MPSQTGVPSDLAASEVDRLRRAIEEFNNKAAEQTAEIIRLTRKLTWLTWAMIVLVAVQVCLALFLKR
ncbi:MAG: hypothetical protein MIO92_03890 [Methanosarcinaceae archaeon]|nr:hypothetical protein [Methanosarcinaceae archaeon]